MKRSLLFIGFLLILSTFISDKQQKARTKILRDLKYLIYLPRDYRKDEIVHWPLILFLHGAGEIGNDLAKVKANGPPKLIAEGKEFPFIIVSPQLPYFEFWNPDLLVKMLKGIINNYRVDEERIYLTGLSMGGFGTWMTAMRYPELFAAIAPVCGGGDPSTAWKIRHTPVWIFHGAKDPKVPLSGSINMASRLIQYDNMKLTIYPNAEHDSWTETYNNDELYKWFLDHKRFRFSQSGLKGLPENYTGLFTSGKDTVRIYQDEDKLKIRPGPGLSPESVLLPGPDNSFYFNENSLAEIKYKFDQNSKMIYFIYYNDFPKNYFRVR
jgi:pimeloyl-ACP methyl ester carboxylesterase